MFVPDSLRFKEFHISVPMLKEFTCNSALIEENLDNKAAITRMFEPCLWNYTIPCVKRCQ